LRATCPVHFFCLELTILIIPSDKYNFEAPHYEGYSSLKMNDILKILTLVRGTRWRNWLRYYATSRKVAGSNPDEVDFFNLPNPSSLTMALGSTQSLTEMSTSNILAQEETVAK
jgi:hypothetical protein